MAPAVLASAALEPGAHHLHRLVAAERAERRHMAVAAHQLPQAVGADLGEGMADSHRAAQPLDVTRRVVAPDTVEPAGRNVCDKGLVGFLSHPGGSS
jgi:hypothetical protein